MNIYIQEAKKQGGKIDYSVAIYTILSRRTIQTRVDGPTNQMLGSKKEFYMIKTRNSIRVVSAFEALEGLLALVGASGLFLLLHKDLEEIALKLIEHAHLNPAAHYPNIFLTAVDHLENTKFTIIALGAIAYSLFRFVEAYGLYHEASWAEVLAALSSAFYLPIEVAELVHRVSLISVSVLVLNLTVVIIVAMALLQHKKRKVKIEAG